MSDDADEVYGRFPLMSEQELVEAAYDVTGGNLKDLPIEKLGRLITVASHVFDLTLNEIERRGLLCRDANGTPIVPYCSEHMVMSALTRDCN